MALSQNDLLYNRYQILSLLGQGGFGAVYQAYDVRLNLACAVKENTETTPQAAQQFQTEAQILARLQHPYLPRVTDYFTIPSQGQYLVMDYIAWWFFIRRFTILATCCCMM